MKQNTIKRAQKVYVKVSADFDCTGCLHPRSIIWSDGRVLLLEIVSNNSD